MLGQNPINRALKNCQIFLPGIASPAFELRIVVCHIGLLSHEQPVLFDIEHTKLNAGLIGVKPHLSPEGIDFFDEMALPNSLQRQDCMALWRFFGNR